MSVMVWNSLSAPILRHYRRKLIAQRNDAAGLVRLLHSLGQAEAERNLNYWCSRQLAPGVIGAIDQLIHYRETLLVRGWLISFNKNLKSLKLALSEELYYPACLGERRSDLLAAFPAEPAALSSGFSGAIDARQTPVEANIKFAALIADGSTVTGNFPAIRVISGSDHPVSKISVSL